MNKNGETQSLNKRIFSLLLIVVLVFGMIPAPTFALPAGVTIQNPGNDPQTALPTSLDNGEIWTDKSVKYLGSADPNDPLNGQFEIMLRAAGQDYKEVQQTANFDIILALDFSLSMNEGSPTKLSKLRTAAKAIAAQLVGSTGNETGNRLAIIKYSTAADVSLNFSTSLSTINTTIDASYSQSYTNIQNAYLKAEETFEGRSDKTRKPILIMISDGAPTVFHSSLTEHTTGNRSQNVNSGAEYVWWTVKQGMKLKLGPDGIVSDDDVPIFTIGFDLVGNSIATATLQPDATNTAAYRPTVYSGNAVNVLESGYDYQQVRTRSRSNPSQSWGSWSAWSLVLPPVTQGSSVITDLTSTPFSGLEAVPSDTWDNPIITGNTPMNSSVITSNNNRLQTETAYFDGTRAGIQYRNIISAQEPFNHKYWTNGFIIGSSYDDLYETLDEISQNFLNTKPLKFNIGTGYENLVVKDVLGGGFEVLGLLPAGVSHANGVVTWTIDGNSFPTMAPDSLALDPGKVSEVKFIVKIKDGAAVNTTHYTNSSAKATFNVAVSNPKYPDDALSQEQILPNNGWLTLAAPPVPATITVTKQITGPVTATDRTFSFTLYDALSGGNAIAGPIQVTVNGASSSSNTFNFNIPYNGFNDNDQATFYVQENDTNSDPFWSYDNASRKAVTVSRGTPTGNVTFTNAYAPKGKLTVFKSWFGNGPTSDITFKLMKKVADDWVLDSSGWEIEKDDAGGVTITGLALDTEYLVVEDFLQDYTAAYDPASVIFSTAEIAAGNAGALEKSITIKNTYVQPKGKITVNKIWDDEAFDAIDRPSTLTFNISGPNGFTGTLTLEADEQGNWSEAFETYVFGEYTFTEVVPLDYEALMNPKSQTISISPVGAREAELTFTNKYIEPKGKITVEKKWAGENDDYASYRPASITLNLYLDGGETPVDSVTLPQQDGTPWEHTFEGLDFGTYHVEEISVPDYTVTYSDPVTISKHGDEKSDVSTRMGRIVVTNTFNNPTGYIFVEKNWAETENDPNFDPNVVRPQTLTVELRKDGSVVDTVEFSDMNGWSHTFTELPLDGSVYTVTEFSTDGNKLDSYTPAMNYGGDSASSAGVVMSPSARKGSASILNTYARGTVAITKNWMDGDNPLGERPQTAVVHLYQIVQPEPIEPTFADVIDPDTEEVTQVMVDPGDPAPAAVTNFIGTKPITRPNLTVVFYDLPLGDNISYYVLEDEIPFYNTTMEDDDFILNDNHPNNIVKIKNEYTNPKGELTVNKSWNHGNNPNPPSEITVELYENDVLKDTQTFSGSYTFKGLDLGKTYTVVEKPILNYAAPDYNGFVSYVPVKGSNSVAPGVVNIENSYVPEIGDLEVIKNWVGKVGADITVTLHRYVGDDQDEAFVRTAVLSADEDPEKDWRHVFTGLELYGPGGVAYSYSVQESGDDLSLYDAVIGGPVSLVVGQRQSIVITNTYSPNKGRLVITKEWLNSDQEPMDPEYPSVTVRLVVNGVPEESTMVLDAQNNWTFVRSNLSAENTYAVEELDTFEEFVVSYSAESVTFDAENLERTITVYNTKTVDDPRIEVTKVASASSLQLVGGTATFEFAITLKNVGNRTLYALTVVDEMTGPDGATMTYSPEPDDVGEDGAVFYLEMSLAPGESTMFNYSVTVNRIGVYDNVVVGYGYHIEDRISDTDDARVSVTETPPTTEQTTEPPTDPTTEPPTTPTTEGTTEPTTEDIPDEDVALGLDIDLIYDEPEALIVEEEDVPLGSALPQTGQLPAGLFYGVGGLITALGGAIRKRRR